MMIQEIKQGMKVRNAGGDVFEIMGTKGDLVIVKMLEHNSGLKPVNFVHKIFTPGEILEIDQTSEIDMLLPGYYEVALEYLELVEEAKDAEIPMFNQGDLVKDKFGNVFKVNAAVDSSIIPGTPGYDLMRYKLELIEWGPTETERIVGVAARFRRLNDTLWIFNTEADAEGEDIVVTNIHLFATELELYDEDECVESDIDRVEVSDVPIFLVGDLVEDKFGNIFRIQDVERFKEEDEEEVSHYNVELVTKQPNSPIRLTGSFAEFDEIGHNFWIYDTAEDAAARGVMVTDRQILATELVLTQSGLQTKPIKSKSKIQKPVKPVKPAKPANSAKAGRAELTRRYPTIKDLQKMSEENDLGKLLDHAYAILKEQAGFGNRIADLNFEKFKRCIPHFEQEGFNVVENGQVIEICW